MPTTRKSFGRLFEFLVLLGKLKLAIAGLVWFGGCFAVGLGVLSTVHLSTVSVVAFSVAAAAFLTLLAAAVIGAIRRPVLHVEAAYLASWVTHDGRGLLSLDATVLLSNRGDKDLLANSVRLSVPTRSGLRKRPRLVDGSLTMESTRHLVPGNDTSNGLLMARVPGVAAPSSDVRASVIIGDQDGRLHRSVVLFKRMDPRLVGTQGTA